MSNGQVVEGTCPVFESNFYVAITEEMYTESDDIHFSLANDSEYQDIHEDPDVANKHLLKWLIQADV